jgi:hypothetical protein
MESTEEAESGCLRKEAVLRMSFANFLFFLAHIVATFVAAALGYRLTYDNDTDRAVVKLHKGTFSLDRK